MICLFVNAFSNRLKSYLFRPVSAVPAEQYESLKREYEKQEKTLAALTVEFMALKKKVNGE